MGRVITVGIGPFYIRVYAEYIEYARDPPCRVVREYFRPGRLAAVYPVGYHGQVFLKVLFPVPVEFRVTGEFDLVDIVRYRRDEIYGPLEMYAYVLYASPDLPPCSPVTFAGKGLYTARRDFPAVRLIEHLDLGLPYFFGLILSMDHPYILFLLGDLARRAVFLCLGRAAVTKDHHPSLVIDADVHYALVVQVAAAYLADPVPAGIPDRIGFDAYSHLVVLAEYHKRRTCIIAGLETLELGNKHEIILVQALSGPSYLPSQPRGKFLSAVLVPGEGINFFRELSRHHESTLVVLLDRDQQFRLPSFPLICRRLGHDRYAERTGYTQFTRKFIRGVKKPAYELLIGRHYLAGVGP